MKTTPLPGGALEYAVLVALWDLGAASAREIHTRVGLRDGLAYTTTAKVLDRLHAKGLVSRKRSGKAFIYRPRVERESLDRARATELVRRFLGPQPRPAVATLVDAVESVDSDLLDELQRAVDARRRSRHGS